MVGWEEKTVADRARKEMPRPAATCSSVSSTPRTRYPALGCGRLVGCVLAPPAQTSGSLGRVAARKHDHLWLGVQRGDPQAGLVDGQSHVADVDAAVQEHRGLVVPFDPLHLPQDG